MGNPFITRLGAIDGPLKEQKMTAWNNTMPAFAELQMDPTRLSGKSNARNSRKVRIDRTHAWDGWLYAALCASAVWPVIQAMGLF